METVEILVFQSLYQLLKVFNKWAVLMLPVIYDGVCHVSYERIWKSLLQCNINSLSVLLHELY